MSLLVLLNVTGCEPGIVRSMTEGVTRADLGRAVDIILLGCGVGEGERDVAEEYAAGNTRVLGY